MYLWKLRLSMVATLAVIFGLSTLVFGILLTLTGAFNIVTMAVLVIVFNVVQWLFSPHLIGAIYRVRELPHSENPILHDMVENLSKKSKIKTPKLMLSAIPLPNAFAYGSPLTGNRVAVTQGLLESLNEGEVEAVLGHEIGHLKHRDVQVMMVVSFLPALFYFIGYSLLLSGIFGGQRRSQGASPLIGLAFMAFSQLLTLFTLHISRLREYYADSHSSSIVDNGAVKLSSGLAKIVHNSSKMHKFHKKQKQSLNSFRALFIADPERAREDSVTINAYRASGQNDELVDSILAKEVTFSDRMLEIFSTHPNMIKRLRALQELIKRDNR